MENLQNICLQIIGKYIMILCDIGNTTFHFLVGNDEFKVSITEDLDRLEFDNFDSSEIYFISVNSDGKEKFKKKFPNSIDLGNNLNFNTTYSNTLGIDRIIACKFIENGIIVDFGSAVTVDIVENNIHLGGSIMAGFDMLKMNYPNISNKLKFDFQENLDLNKLPTNTDEAISFAILNMIVLPIKEMQKRYNQKLIITGETSKYFLPYFDNFEFRNRLIFESMKKIIEEQK
ncbi:MAG: type III pantothenate kinase [Arcobacter sp.]|nr:type III pantothenate kinase [Arcobacter sp.]